MNVVLWLLYADKGRVVFAEESREKCKDSQSPRRGTNLMNAKAKRWFVQEQEHSSVVRRLSRLNIKRISDNVSQRGDDPLQTVRIGRLQLEEAAGQIPPSQVKRLPFARVSGSTEHQRSR